MGIDYNKRPSRPSTPPADEQPADPAPAPAPDAQPQGGFPPPPPPQQGYPQGGYPPPTGYPQQGYPQPGYPPPQGNPQQGAPPPLPNQGGGYPPPAGYPHGAPQPPYGQPPAQPGQPHGGGVSLSKVTLTKSAPTVSLTKHGGQRGVMRINLNWDARPPAKGLFRKNTQLDLDLGCLYEFSDGTKGVVQALGNSFRAAPRTGGPDIIVLDGDDRSGAVSGGENMSINLEDLPKIRRILVFALIYEGAANWAAARGVLTIFPIGAPPIEVQLDDPRDGARICAVAMLTNDHGELTIRREVNYLNGAQRMLDQAYGWGMNWTPGRK